jgi:hypothetical protein
MPARSSTDLRLLARELLVERAQVDQHQVVVGAARDQAEAVVPSASASAWRWHDLLRVVGELGLRRLVERDRLAGDHVLERAALPAGEDGLVDGAACSALLRMQPPRGPRSVLWVVKVTMSA